MVRNGGAQTAASDTARATAAMRLSPEETGRKCETTRKSRYGCASSTLVPRGRIQVVWTFAIARKRSRTVMKASVTKTNAMSSETRSRHRAHWIAIKTASRTMAPWVNHSIKVWRLMQQGARSRHHQTSCQGEPSGAGSQSHRRRKAHRQGSSTRKPGFFPSGAEDHRRPRAAPSARANQRALLSTHQRADKRTTGGRRANLDRVVFLGGRCQPTDRCRSDAITLGAGLRHQRGKADADVRAALHFPRLSRATHYAKYFASSRNDHHSVHCDISREVTGDRLLYPAGVRGHRRVEHNRQPGACRQSDLASRDTIQRR